MDCKTVTEKLNAYVDGELTKTDTEMVERHLSRCQSCREDMRLIEAVNAILDLTPGIPVPPNFADETVRKARSLMRDKLSLGEWWRGLTAVWKMAACATALAGLLIGAGIPQSLLLRTEGAAAHKSETFFASEPSLSQTYLKLVSLREDEE